MTGSRPSRTRPVYEHPLFLATVPALVVGLLLLTIEDLKWWVPLVVGAGLALLAALALLVLALRRRVRSAVQAYRDLKADHLKVKDAVKTLEARLSLHVMFEIVWEAERKGWRIDAGPNGTEFTSPDDDVAVIPHHRLNWYTISKELANTSPHHWDAGWMPPVVAQGQGNVMHTAHLEQTVKALAEVVARIDDRTDPKKVAERNAMIKKLLADNPNFGKHPNTPSGRTPGS